MKFKLPAFLEKIENPVEGGPKDNTIDVSRPAEGKDLEHKQYVPLFDYAFNQLNLNLISSSLT